MPRNPQANLGDTEITLGVAQRFSAAMGAVIAIAALAAEVPFRKLTRLLLILVTSIGLSSQSLAVTRPHIISFGKTITVDWIAGTAADEKPVPIKVRALIVDGRTKEYVTGAPHEITERLFVVRRVFRLNDGLPDDSTPKWQWERGGWLLVDRGTGHIAPINLPEFDPRYSAASWYRDYVAYCGVSDDGKKRFTVVAQLNRRKPVLKKAVADGVAEDAPPDSACPAPTWQRSPIRVTFEPLSAPKQTFAIRGHVVDVVNDEDDEE